MGIRLPLEWRGKRGVVGALRATPKGPCVAGARERGADARGEGCRAERGGAQERGGGGCAAPTSTAAPARRPRSRGGSGGVDIGEPGKPRGKFRALSNIALNNKKLKPPLTKNILL